MGQKRNTFPYENSLMGKPERWRLPRRRRCVGEDNIKMNFKYDLKHGLESSDLETEALMSTCEDDDAK